MTDCVAPQPVLCGIEVAPLEVVTIHWPLAAGHYNTSHAGTTHTMMTSVSATLQPYIMDSRYIAVQYKPILHTTMPDKRNTLDKLRLMEIPKHPIVRPRGRAMWSLQWVGFFSINWKDHQISRVHGSSVQYGWRFVSTSYPLTKLQMGCDIQNHKQISSFEENYFPNAITPWSSWDWTERLRLIKMLRNGSLMSANIQRLSCLRQFDDWCHELTIKLLIWEKHRPSPK